MGHETRNVEGVVAHADLGVAKAFVGRWGLGDLAGVQEGVRGDVVVLWEIGE